MGVARWLRSLLIAVVMLHYGIAAAAPQPGWWWNSNESGRGFFIESRDAFLYLGGYFYDEDGHAKWLVSGGANPDPYSYSGRLLAFSNGQSLFGTYAAPSPPTDVGAISVTFADDTHGTIAWPGGSIPIERHVFDTSTASFQPSTGWWWNPAESGSGYSVEVQGGRLFAVGFMYETNGRHVWYFTAGAMSSPTTYRGTLLQVAGGQTLTGPYRPPSSYTTIGTIAVNFTGTDRATLTITDEGGPSPTGKTRTISIQPQLKRASPVLPIAAGVQRLSADILHVVAARADGSVITWGSNLYGALGSGPPVPGTTARAVTGVSAVSVAAGRIESLAVGSDGLIRGWGTKNSQSIIGGEVPVLLQEQVGLPVLAAFPPGMLNVVIANNGGRAVALRNDGTLWYMPGEATMLLDLGRIRLDAKQVPGLTGVRSIAGGLGLATAVTNDGNVWTLRFSPGPAPFSWSATAVQVGGLSNIQSASCSGLHCLAIANDGTVWAVGLGVGSNSLGQLGNNSTTDSLLPVRVHGLSNVVTVVAGALSSHAITSDGRLWNWGAASTSGLAGQIENLLVPRVLPNFSDVLEVTAGGPTMIRRADGTVWGWEPHNIYGELGTGGTTGSLTPVQALGINLN